MLTDLFSRKAIRILLLLKLKNKYSRIYKLKFKKIIKSIPRLLALALVVLSVLVSCRPHAPSMGGGNIRPSDNVPKRFTPDEDKIATFENGPPEGFWPRNDRGNGYPFNCEFRSSNIWFENGIMTLALNKQDNRYVGAEYRTWGKFSYGYYSVSMKAASCDGVISSFFTYTGHPWDEIDIEFLGHDMTIVQFNYYTNGVGGHEYYYELGFDASKDFHEYGFDWQPDSITWYVDGKAVYRATENIPSALGHIMMNLWNVHESNSSWAGRFDESKLPVYAQYQWIGYKSAE